MQPYASFEFQITLFEPEIPQNTGNIIRLCAATSAKLHLIEPLGFTWDDARVKRAGLDYHEFAEVKRYKDYLNFKTAFLNSRIFAITTKWKTPYHESEFQPNDVCMFGPETRGLPSNVLEEIPEERHLRIPMQAERRSLNLANSVGIVLYEAWRQMGFVGGV